MNLKVFKRELVGKKVKTLRKESKVPGVVYSKFLEKTINIYFDKMDFIKIYRVSGESKPLNLQGDGIKQLVMIQDMKLDPVSNELLHVDFLAVKMDEKVQAEIPVVITGESVVEKGGEGKLELVRKSINVEALPSDLPQEIQVDVTSIETGNDVIFVKDIKLGDKVTMKDSEDLPVVTVVTIKEEVEEEVSEEGEGTSEEGGEEKED